MTLKTNAKTELLSKYEAAFVACGKSHIKPEKQSIIPENGSLKYHHQTFKAPYREWIDQLH